MKALSYLLITCLPLVIMAQQVVLSGYCVDKATGEHLSGCSVSISAGRGTVSNNYGFYSISLAPGVYDVTFSFVGYSDQHRHLDIQEDLRFDASLQPDTLQLGTVEVVARPETTPSSQSITMSAQEIRSLPSLLGEPDVIRSIKLLPGVSAATETSSGFSVRGGNYDHNLILLDEATIYNPSHLMGIFAIFNPDAISNITFQKQIPARYGGRLASVVDVRMKEGNNQMFSASGGIGTSASRLTLEGPLANKKASFMVSGRRTYVDLFLPWFEDEDVQNTRIYFYDLNAKMNYRPNDKHRFLFAGYLGKDLLKYSSEDFSPQIDWGNAFWSLRWNYVLGPRLFSTVSLVSGGYQFSGLTSSVLTQVSNAQGAWHSDLHDWNAKADLEFFQNDQTIVHFGAQSIFHTFHPGKAELRFDSDDVYGLTIPEARSVENGLYGEWIRDFDQVKLNIGARVSSFHNMGPATVYGFDDQFEIVDSSEYSSGIYNSFYGFEPRVGLDVPIVGLDMQLSYQRTYQYVQVVSNSNGGTPVDVWVSASPNIKPQYADQLALSFTDDFAISGKPFGWEVGGFYKKLHNQIDYKDHADLLLTPVLETQLRDGNGHAYGLEMLVDKKGGMVAGWISYTLSRSIRQADQVNGGDPYPAPQDRPHNLAIVINAKLGEKLRVSSNFVYYSGTPFTSPVGRFEYGGQVLPIYSERNADRFPDYHRLDISITYEMNSIKRRWQHSWSLSLYNVYNRKNPTTIYFGTDFFNSKQTQATMMYVLPFVPSISYNFKF